MKGKYPPDYASLWPHYIFEPRKYFLALSQGHHASTLMSICGWAQGMRAGVQKEDQAGCITQETCHPLPAPWSASSSSPQEVVTGYWKVKSRAGWDKPQNTEMSSPHSSGRRRKKLRDSHPSGSHQKENREWRVGQRRQEPANKWS